MHRGRCLLRGVAAIATVFLVTVVTIVAAPPTSASPQVGITVAGGNGQGSAANQLSRPNATFVDGSGNVYVSDFFNYRVQKWAPGATSGTTVAGGNGEGSAANQLDGHWGLFVDGTGNVYIVDANGNARVQKWAPGATSGTTVAGGNGKGPAANQLLSPVDVYVDPSGNVYVADAGNARVQKWAPGATAGTTVAGGNGQGSAANQFDGPVGVFVDASGNVYVTDVGNERVTKWAPGATAGTTVAGGNGYGGAANQFRSPYDLWLDGTGNVYVADSQNHRVQKWAPGATAGTTVAGGNGQGSAADQLSVPLGISVDSVGNVYVADTFNSRVQKWPPATVGAPPTNVDAGPLDGGASVRWKAPAPVTGLTIIGYAIDVYLGSTFVSQTSQLSTATVRSVTGLTNAKNYNFRVRAIYSGPVSGPQSSPSSPIAVGAPIGPARPRVAPGTNAATVSWIAPASNGSSVVGYVVYPYQGGTPLTPRTFNSTATAQQVTGLTNGKAYHFKVAAMNARGTGPKSSASPDTIVGTPVAPTALTAAGGHGSATLHWSASTNSNAAPLTGYVVTPFINKVAQPSVVFNSLGTTQTVAGLSPGTYTFRVFAKNSFGVGGGTDFSTPTTVMQA